MDGNVRKALEEWRADNSKASAALDAYRAKRDSDGVTLTESISAGFDFFKARLEADERIIEVMAAALE